jgi:16S rRNA (guanine527-N7)-methyltransferase
VTLEADIQSGARSMGLALDEDQRSRLAAHLRLVEKWNRVHNLTAVRETDQMVVLHVLDSLSLIPHLGAAQSLLDVGSGPGFPASRSRSRVPISP